MRRIGLGQRGAGSRGDGATAREGRPRQLYRLVVFVVVVVLEHGVAAAGARAYETRCAVAERHHPAPGGLRFFAAERRPLDEHFGREGLWVVIGRGRRGRLGGGLIGRGLSCRHLCLDVVDREVEVRRLVVPEVGSDQERGLVPFVVSAHAHPDSKSQVYHVGTPSGGSAGVARVARGAGGQQTPGMRYPALAFALSLSLSQTLSLSCAPVDDGPSRRRPEWGRRGGRQRDRSREPRPAPSPGS